MNKINELITRQVGEIPDKPYPKILYVCLQYNIAVHLCACGCGVKTVTPLEEGEWKLTMNENNEATLRPSIGNFMGENPYHAHYYITDNKIQWL